MRGELIKRFDTNEKDHERVRAAIEILQAGQSDLGGRLANVQQGLAATTDQAREILENIITDSRTALIEVRGEGILALLAAMTQTRRSELCAPRWQTRSALISLGFEPSWMRRRHASNKAEVPRLLRWIRILRQQVLLLILCVARTRGLQQHRVVQLTAQGVSPPDGLAGGAGVGPPALPGLRQVRDEHLRFEVSMKVWEGPGRDRKPLEMTKDASGYASRRVRTLTVVACKYTPGRDLLLLAEREKNPIDDVTKVAMAAEAGITLLPAEVRLLSDTIFDNVKLLLHDNLLPRPRLSVCGLVLWRKLHDVGRGSSDLINREKVKSHTNPRRGPNLDDLAVKLELWKGAARTA